MKEHLAKLVGVILQRLEEGPDSPSSESGMRSWLVGQGYNKRDIDAALKLVWPRRPVPARTSARTRPALRQLSSFEAHKLTQEAQDALARLDLYDLIDPSEREMLLDRLSQFDGEVSPEDLDYLLSWVLSMTRDVESQQTIFNVFEGRRDTLH